MKSFRFTENILTESSNYELGAAYETATALHLHNSTHSERNTSTEHLERIKKMKNLHDEAMSKFPADKQKEIMQRGKDSANAYLKSLKTNHGIHPHHVEEVHHTYAGIDSLVGKKVSQHMNPHDIAIKTKDGKLHGASLKFSPGTLSNNPTKAFDKMSTEMGIKTDTHGVWNHHSGKAGLSGMTKKQKKEVRDNPEIKDANMEAKKQSALHHTDSWNGAKHEDHKKFLQHITKSDPHIPYDYVVGHKGGTAEPIKDKHIHKLISNAKSLKATHNGTNLVHIHDHEGNHVMTFEHRPTHGSFISTQVNAKYGTGKAKAK